MTDEAHQVLNFLASSPDFGTITVKSSVLKELLLATDGNIMARGRLWDIKTKNLGVGVYKLQLELCR